jgi:RNA polymerase sigma-70 factor (ECF subfamily)
LTTPSEKTGESICIASLKRGDSRVFAHFVRVYQNMVFACCRTVGLRDEDVEDAAGEAFLAAYTSIKNYSGKSKLSSWLWKIAYYKALDYRKKWQNKTTQIKIEIETLAAPAASPEVSVSVEEQNAAVWQAVQRLSQPQAAAIVLHYREGKPIEEIARILETPENTVKTYLHRGRKELYSQLQSVWETDYVRK